MSQMGFHDFAGSTAVHMVGGIAAGVGAKILGPRIGKYDKNGKPQAILGHNLSIGALGVFILWFCWFGFNGCSTVAMDSDSVMELAGAIFCTTNMSAAVACVVTMIFTWLRYGKPDVSMTFNAALGGLVAITAGCDMVSIFGAAVIGACAGIVLPMAVEFFDKVVKIDDPVALSRSTASAAPWVPCSRACWRWTAVCSTAAAPPSSSPSALVWPLWRCGCW